MARAVPQIVGVAAAVATTVALTAAFGPAGALASVGAFLGGAAPIVAGLVGAVVATGASMLTASVMGLNRRPRAPDLTASAQDRKQLLRQSVAPRQIVYGTARVGGVMAYAFSFGADSRFLGMVSVLATHRIAGVDEIWVDDTAIPIAALDGNGMVTTGRFAGKLRVGIQLGTQTAADPVLIADSPDGWGADHKLLGCAYIYLRFEYDADVFPGGVRNIGATIRGKADILDPRSGLTGWTDNWALCVLDYLRSPLGVRALPEEIDTPTFIAAANLADEAVVINAAGATQPRYRCDGVVGMDLTRREILGRLLSAGAGALVYVQGRYRLYGGAFTTPTDSLTSADLAGAARIGTRPARRDLFNGVKGTFIDPGRFWQAAEFPAVTSAAYESQDGQRLWRDLELPFTRDSIRAQRLARIELLRGREPLTIEVPVKYAAFRFAVWQMLSVTIAEIGITARPMRVTSFRFTPPQGEDGPLLVLRLREESAASYAWSHADASVPANPPDTTLASPFSLPAPAGLTLREELFLTRDGNAAQARLVAAWASVPSAFVVGYDIQYRQQGGDWRAATGTLGETTANIDDLADGLWDVRVRARSAISPGAWATATIYVGALAAQPPVAVTGVSLQQAGGWAFLRWDLHPDLDVRAGGRIVVRHTEDVGAATWGQSTSIGDAVAGSATSVVLPMKSGTYLLKAVDAGGRASPDAATVASDGATALEFAPVTSIAEHPGFAGAGNGVVLLDGVLRLASEGVISAEPSIAAIAKISALGGIRGQGSYAFAAGADLGALRAVRLRGRLRTVVVNTLDLIGTRDAPISTWRSMAGAAGDEGDAWIEYRATPDNPLAAPVWSEWRRLDQSEARARGVQFRLQLRSVDPAFNIHCAELGADIEEVA